MAIATVTTNIAVRTRDPLASVGRRFVMVRISYVFALALTLASAMPASAQQDSAAPAPTPPLFAERQAVSDAVPIFSPAPSVTPARQKRPSVLVPMYVSFAALQG